MSKQNPKVLLVYPPNQLMSVEIPRPDGSLGPLYLAGALRQAGIEVELLDASVGTDDDSMSETFFRRQLQPNGLTRIGMTQEKIKEHFSKGGYDIIAIHNNFTPQTRMALEVARLAREVNPKILIIAGGVNARVLAPRLLKTNLIDIIGISEGEKTIVDIIHAWQNNTPLSDLGAITYQDNGKTIIKPVTKETICQNLDDLPFPAWDLLPFDKYDELNSPHGSIKPGAVRRYASIMTSRGCPFQCLYCHNSEEKQVESLTGATGMLRFKSIERVMKEVKIIQSLGVTHLYIEDDSFLANKNRATEILTRLADKNLKISNVNGVNLLNLVKSGHNGKFEPDKEFLKIIKNSGFDEIVFPVESGSQRILDKYASGKLQLDKVDVVRLVNTAAELGIVCPINIMIGFPDETEEEIFKSIELAKKLIPAGAPYITFFLPIPFPGSKLFNYAVQNGCLSPDFDPDMMNWKNACMKNTAVPPERLVELRDWAWKTVNTDEYKRGRLGREIGSPRLAQTTE